MPWPAWRLWPNRISWNSVVIHVIPALRKAEAGRWQIWVLPVQLNNILSQNRHTNTEDVVCGIAPLFQFPSWNSWHSTHLEKQFFNYHTKLKNCIVEKRSKFIGGITANFLPHWQGVPKITEEKLFGQNHLQRSRAQKSAQYPVVPVTGGSVTLK